MGFEDLSYDGSIFCIVLVALFALFPEDFALAVAYATSYAKDLTLNYVLMFRAWRLHRQTVRDFASIGLPPPAFHFTPIWKR
jgi:hypothetical protein